MEKKVEMEEMITLKKMVGEEGEQQQKKKNPPNRSLNGKHGTFLIEK